MSQGRPFLLLGLLVFLLGAGNQPAAKNEIAGLAVTLDEAGDWHADFDYSFTGDPPTVIIRLDIIGTPTDGSMISRFPFGYVRPMLGTHHTKLRIRHPGGLRVSTVFVGMYMSPTNEAMVASQSVRQPIDFPVQDADAASPEAVAQAVEKDLKEAARFIDYGSDSDLTHARHILERLIESNPKLAQAYVELARVAMKTNWSAQGLHQAENLLDSALQIEPDSANAQILMGYVYAHQKRFPQAEALFAQAAKSGTGNTWLWCNWGELFLMQGKPDQAIPKYREVLQHPMTTGRWDIARLDAYRHLIALLQDRRDLDGMEALYKQRVQDFGPGSCYSAEYSLFLLNVRGDAQGAIDLAHRALKQDCDDSESRSILGLASYVQWAATDGAASVEALNQARIYMPAGPMAFYRLATSENTMPALRKLLATGEAIDYEDNDGMTALAYAVQRRDGAAIKRLLSLGAKADEETLKAMGRNDRSL